MRVSVFLKFPRSMYKTTPPAHSSRTLCLGYLAFYTVLLKLFLPSKKRNLKKIGRRKLMIGKKANLICPVSSTLSILSKNDCQKLTTGMLSGQVAILKVMQTISSRM